MEFNPKRTIGAKLTYQINNGIDTSLGAKYIGKQYYKETNHFRHFLTTGAFGIGFFMVIVIITYVHTGRILKSNLWIASGVMMLIVATFCRSLIPFFEELYHPLIGVSMFFWIVPFGVYWLKTKSFLLNNRVDGVKG